MKETLSQTFLRFRAVFAKKPWLWGAVIGVVVVVAGLTYWLGTHPFSSSQDSSLTLQDALPLPADLADLKTLTFLLLGYGGAGHSGGSLSDVIQVARLDFEHSKLVLISVPRDLWVALPNGTQNKINAAYSIDIQNRDDKAMTAKRMAQAVTGFPIDYFVAVDFVGFERIIGEELKGIEVQVEETMVDNWYPVRGRELDLCGLTSQEIAQVHAQYSGFELEKQFACRYEVIRYPAGVNHMEGGDALKYVRSRHGTPGGDFARGKRQQEVLAAIRDRLFSLEGATQIPQLFENLNRHVQTDVDWRLVEYLWPALRASKDYQIVRINLSTENVLTGGTSAGGASIVQPRESWDAVHQYIQSELSEE